MIMQQWMTLNLCHLFPIFEKVYNQEFLDKVNQRYVGPYAAATQSHSNAIWLAEVKEMNLQQFHNLKSLGKTAITIYAQHKPSSQNKSMPTKEESDILFTQTTSKNPKKFKTATKLELCIGSTVMLLNNLGTEVGLTNGTLGKLIAHIRIDSKTL